jgi:PASTA domain
MRSKIVLVGLAVLAAFVIACGAGSSKSPAQNPGDQQTGGSPAVYTPAAEPTTPVVPPAPTTPATLVIPDGLIGQNAQIAYEQLDNMGFTNVIFASGDPDATMVLYPPNWHVIKVEPAPGTAVLPGSTIILTCSKQ